MELYSTRTIIRPWRRGDDERADRWPPYHDPFEPIWNLPRSFSSSDFWPIGNSEREVWAVENYDRQLMGRISLREIDRRALHARLGITFGAGYIGRGLGSEALTSFLNGYFNIMRFGTMLLDVAAPNLRAVHCYERLGFRYVGSDWRQASSSFDRYVLDRTNYRQFARHFRSEPRGLYVEFYEMRLDEERWLLHKHLQRAVS
jgi:RimJ/RimL family protein N-acetyltransferase